MSAIPWGRQLAWAAGAAQGQQQNVGRMLSVWGGGRDWRGVRSGQLREDAQREQDQYFARLQAQERQDQQDALQEAAFSNNVFLEKLRQKGRDELQQDRLTSMEARTREAVDAANARAEDRIKAAEERAKMPNPTRFATDIAMEEFAKQQAALMAKKQAQLMGVTDSPEDKAQAAREKDIQKRELAEIKRLSTTAGQAETAAKLRRKGQQLPGIYGRLAGSVVSDAEFSKMVTEDRKQGRIDARQDKSIRATGARQDKALGARSEASDERLIEKHEARMASLGADAAKRAQKEYEEAIDPIFGDPSLAAPKEGESPEAFAARREAFRSEAEARNFKAMTREALLQGGMEAIANMDPAKAQQYLGTLIRLAQEGRLDPKDFQTLFAALQQRLEGTRR